MRPYTLCDQALNKPETSVGATGFEAIWPHITSL